MATSIRPAIRLVMEFPMEEKTNFKPGQNRLQTIFNFCHSVLELFRDAPNNDYRHEILSRFHSEFYHRFFLEFTDQEHALVSETWNKMYHAL